MASDSIDYAKLGGIDSVAAAVIFAIVYVPLSIFYIFQSIRRPTYVLIVLTLFCLIRITAFSIRAALADSTSAAHNESLFIAEEVLYTAGFFGVLYSAYTLVLDREQLYARRELPGVIGKLNRITGNRHLIRLVLMISIVLGIIGVTDTINASSESKMNTGMTLRRVSVYIFLAVTCILALRTLVLAMEQGSGSYDDSIEMGAIQRPPQNPSFGSRHGVIVLAVIVILLLIREVFYGATSGSTDTSRQNKAYNEAFFYPLAALPELLAVALFAVPGLVPSREELKMQQAYAAKA